MNTIRSRACLCVLALSALSTGCVTQDQHRSALADRESQIRLLREERTQLKNQLRDLEYQRDSLETSVLEANARLAEMSSMPAAQPDEPRFAELDEFGIGYGTRNGRVVISIPSEVTFGSGKASLSSKGQSALRAVASTLGREYPSAEYWIQGHTDSDPIKKSSFPTNRDLSLARAMEVLHFLVAETGIDDSQCVVAGHGEYDPVAPNDNSANKARNRRVEIVVHQPGT